MPFNPEGKMERKKVILTDREKESLPRLQAILANHHKPKTLEEEFPQSAKLMRFESAILKLSDPPED